MAHLLAILVLKMTKKGSWVIIGRHPVMEAIRSGQSLDKVMVDRGIPPAELLELCRQHNIPIQKVPKEKLDKYGVNHQGVAAYRSQVEYMELEELVPHLFDQGKVPLLLILDRITDVGNFGSICRSAEVLGAHGLIFPIKESAQINADTVKRSSGALLRIPLIRTKDLAGAVKFLQQSGLQVFAADEQGKTSIHESDLQQPLALILGSEDQGIATALLKRADHIIHIPQIGKLDSLNVSVAAGILLYEIQRQRQV
jgi:23S rRNA (guanosine2251-2'-O)-methyltransferase